LRCGWQITVSQQEIVASQGTLVFLVSSGGSEYQIRKIRPHGVVLYRVQGALWCSYGSLDRIFAMP